ncbi:citrate lyase subunit alpha [Salmonella enterica subsp. enterica serovar Infantis]
MKETVTMLNQQYVVPEGLQPYQGVTANSPWLASETEKRRRKICDSLEEAIRRSGLKNGMTISFHHAFRGGDKVVNMVMAKLAEMGFRDLTLASSSLIDAHWPLIEHIKNGVVRQIYTSGLRGKLGEEISAGLMENPVQIHSHGGRVKLIQSGELNIDVAFLGVPCCDEFGNANGFSGKSRCGSLGYAQVDAQYAKCVVLLTEEWVEFPNYPASIAQDQVDLIVQVDEVGDPEKITAGAIRLSSNPRELLIARQAANVIEHSGYFCDGFSLQTGTGGASSGGHPFPGRQNASAQHYGEFWPGGITGTMVDLHEKGLIKALLDTQSFDGDAARSLAQNPHHIEISTNQYANPASKGAACERLNVVMLSALEIDVNFNVNVMTGSNGVLRGASGGHSDTAAGADLTIITAPLVRGRIPCVVEKVLTTVTPGASVDVLVTDHGIAVNPARQDLLDNLRAAGVALMTIEQLQQRAEQLTGKPQPIEFTDRVVAVVRYRDGSVIDVIRQVKG